MDINNLFGTTVGVLERTIDLRARNQVVISSNIANVETPNYMPKTLTFQGELSRAIGRQASGLSNGVTNAAHIPLRGNAGRVSEVRGRLVDAESSVGGDGNGVTLEGEMSRMTANQIQFDTAVQLLNKKLQLLNVAIKENK